LPQLRLFVARQHRRQSPSIQLANAMAQPLMPLRHPATKSLDIADALRLKRVCSSKTPRNEKANASSSSRALADEQEARCSIRFL
jgi:hypothetical protein